MEHGVSDEGYADMAGPRHEFEGRGDDKKVEAGIPDNDHHQGGADLGAEDIEVGVEQRQEDPELIRRAEIMASRYWSGVLPPPDEFKMYPEPVQEKIVSWAERSIEMQDRVTEKALALDEAESRRLDRASEVDAQQIPRAQFGTIALNLALIIGAVACGILGRTASCGMLVGGLAVINVATLFVSRAHGRRVSDRPADGRGGQPDSRHSTDR